VKIESMIGGIPSTVETMVYRLDLHSAE